ncbi:hypothetical protein N8I77_002253 [Diaporthe amygdali]|uniref:Ricin B lectin domain-containing protein n=1 Tax=Phomopsis amygdali TaxID=1214568 RepID=A0AAD9SQK1_PHOAM|nr:hypothetical protein N8I77_002253 [Diaporthe amygdali]
MSLNFDTNAWYQVNVTKFPGSSLLGTSLFQDGKTGAVFYQNTNTSAKGQSWQFYPYNSSVYLLRCKDGGPNGYLAAAAGKTDTDQSDVTGNTVPILANYNVTDDSMFWTVAPWGDGTYYFSNLANGSEWRLSVMDNKLMVMDSNTLPAQSGEHYTFTSLSTIGDSRYSTVNTYPTTSRTENAVAPTTTSTITATGDSTPSPSAGSSPSESSSGGLSTGAAAGIGVGVGLAVAILVAFLAIFFIRRRKNARTGPGPEQTNPVGDAKYQPAANGRFHEMGTTNTFPEMPTSARSQPHEVWTPPMELQGDSRR